MFPKGHILFMFDSGTKKVPFGGICRGLIMHGKRPKGFTINFSTKDPIRLFQWDKLNQWIRTEVEPAVDWKH